jgi:hypothetical protein
VADGAASPDLHGKEGKGSRRGRLVRITQGAGSASHQQTKVCKGCGPECQAANAPICQQASKAASKAARAVQACTAFGPSALQALAHAAGCCCI